MLSIVMPVFNEEFALGDCLDRVLAQAGDYEVIVVDGGSSDATVSIAAARKGIRLLSSSKGRGNQMNAGAKAATGEWLLFLHADTQLQPNAIARLTELMKQEELFAGCFWHQFDSWHPFLMIVSLIHNLRFRATGIIYGDQCLFIRRALFWQLEGFKEGIVMEDIEFSERLLRVARPVCLPLKALTSARKFRALGIYRATIRVLSLMYRYGRDKDLRRDLFFSDIR